MVHISQDQSPNKIVAASPRFQYIDQFRGFVGILMLVGHCSYYFNAVWLNLDPLDPLFSSWGQFALRYVGYLCAPGFLMMSGAMVWWSFHRRVEKGTSGRKASWHLIQRGLFLIFLQITWVNSSWGGFSVFNPGHFGIIACIGCSVILLTLIVKLNWQWRLAIALLILVVHPFLLQISYNPDNVFARVLMQTFIDAGTYNKYPVLPWFALSVMGSVMATGWLKVWKSDKERIVKGLLIALVALVVAIAIRLSRGYGNIFPFSNFGSYSFFLDQKYPPSLFMSLLSFSSVVFMVSLFIAIGKISPKILMVFTVPGKVPLFFYGMHLAILGIFVKRMDFFYREGGIAATFIGVAVMLVIMLPLCKWFYGVKRKSNNYFIKLI